MEDDEKQRDRQAGRGGKRQPQRPQDGIPVLDTRTPASELQQSAPRKTTEAPHHFQKESYAGLSYKAMMNIGFGVSVSG